MSNDTATPLPPSRDAGAVLPSGGSGMSAAGSARSSGRARWRRWRWPLLIGLVVVLAALVTALTIPDADDGERLGVRNPGPDGGRALARILQREGVDVRAERRSAAAVAATDARSTLLVTRTDLLGPAQLDRLAADDARHLVLVEPDEITLSRLAPQVRAAGETPEAEVRDPGCQLAAAVAAGSARAGGRLYAPVPTPSAPAGPIAVCYAEPGRDEGPYVSLESPGRQVTVIGRPDLLTNEHLDSDGNAALALWTLGAERTLVWYSPDPLEPAGSGGRPSFTELLPDWVLWVLVQSAVAVAVAILWRARRLGRLVPEPLPVVVRAAETQEGRARLYRQASARGRAGATLRTSTLRRLARRLAAPPGTTADQLVSLVAGATGHRPGGEERLRALLLGPPPENDAALIRLADDLDTLEREFSRHDPKGSPP